MEYILTQIEMDNLRPLSEVRQLQRARRLLVKKVLEIGKLDCVKDASSPEGSYCDRCPLSEAFNGWTEESKLLCPERFKHYSK